MKIVLRNHGNGCKNAVYIIVTSYDDKELDGYSGSWTTYQLQGISHLRHQAKPGHGQYTVLSNLEKLLRDKLRKGYIPVKLIDVPQYIRYTVSKYGKFPNCEVIEASKVTKPGEWSPKALAALPTTETEPPIGLSTKDKEKIVEYLDGLRSQEPSAPAPAKQAPMTRGGTRAAALEL